MNMEYKDYYKIMGIERSASPEEIKRAYRRLARKYHPDVSKEAHAEEKFKELGEAYEVLKDPQKRSQYDQYGEYWKHQGQQQQTHSQTGNHANPGGAYHHQSFHENIDMAGFEDFIQSIFSQQQQARHQRHHHAPFSQPAQQDIHAKLSISLEDSYTGAEKMLQIQVPHLDATGRMEQRLKSVRVKIPKGIGNQQQIRLKGQGVQTSAGNAGDLYIEIHLDPHPLFHLKDKDIHLKVPITPWEAALGATIRVPTLGGEVQVKIPAQTQSGKQMRLKDRGLPGKPAGDQYLLFEIILPPAGNEKLHALFEQMAAASSFNPRESLGVC